MANTKYIRNALVGNERIVYAASLHRFSYVFPMIFLIIGGFLLSGHAISMPEERIEEMGQAYHMYDFVMVRIDNFIQSQPEQLQKLISKLSDARKMYLGVLLVAFGLVQLTNAIIKHHTMEHVVTNKKVVLKKGLVAVDMNELSLDRIESVKIHQNALDRMIHRGRVNIAGVGMEQIIMRNMAKPAKLRQAILEAIDRFGGK